MTGKNYYSAPFSKFESHLRTYEKGYGFYSNSIVPEKCSSRDTVLLWDIVPWGHLRHMSSLATIESSLQATQLQQQAV
jgi:hypothetical protein